MSGTLQATPGVYIATFSASDGHHTTAVTGTVQITVTKEETTLTYTGPTLLAQNMSNTLTALLTDSWLRRDQDESSASLHRGCVVSVVVAAPAGGHGARSGSASAAERVAATFTFGRERGTILPYQVVISPSGEVAVTGTVQRIAQVSVSQPALAALLKLATAERFFSMPAQTRCKAPVGGLATNYITIRRGTTTKSVADYGGCNRGFVELFAVLKAVTAIA